MKELQIRMSGGTTKKLKWDDVGTSVAVPAKPVQCIPQLQGCGSPQKLFLTASTPNSPLSVWHHHLPAAFL